jgi:hypothetical protein
MVASPTGLGPKNGFSIEKPVHLTIFHVKWFPFCLDVNFPSKTLIEVEAEILCFSGCRYLYVVHCYWWAHFVSRGECYLDGHDLVNRCSPSGA